jgi:hypothetical protein
MSKSHRIVAGAIACLLLIGMSACGGGGSGDGGSPASPSVALFIPGDQALFVPVGIIVSAAFDRAMDEATLTGASVRLEFDADGNGSGDSTVTGTVTAVTIGGTTTVTFRPDNPLTANGDFVFTIDATATDTLGNALTGGFTATFRTLPDAANGPYVTGVIPTNGATGVSPQTLVTVLFDRQMDISTLNAASINLTRVGGGNVAITVLGVPASQGLAVVTPNAALAAGAEYRVDVSTACEDTAGTPIQRAVSTTFTVGTGGEPGVAATLPLNGATDVGIFTDVVITFDRPMDESTITTGSVSVVPRAGGPPVAATVSSFTALTNTVTTLSPTSGFAADTEYELRVTTAVEDESGTPLPAAYVSTFRTAAPTIDADLVGRWVDNPGSPTTELQIDVNGALTLYDIDTVSYSYTVIPVVNTELFTVDGTVYARVPGTSGSGIVGIWVDVITQSLLTLTGRNFTWARTFPHQSGTITTVETSSGVYAAGGGNLTLKATSNGRLTVPAAGTYDVTLVDTTTRTWEIDGSTLYLAAAVATRTTGTSGLEGIWDAGSTRFEFGAPGLNTDYQITDGDHTPIDRIVEDAGQVQATAGALLGATRSRAGDYTVTIGGTTTLQLAENEAAHRQLAYSYAVGTDTLTLGADDYTRASGTPGGVDGEWESAGAGLRFTIDTTLGLYEREVIANGETEAGALTDRTTWFDLSLTTEWTKQ